jgi:hypothetical protein
MCVYLCVLWRQVLEVVFGSSGLRVFIRQQTAFFYRQCNEFELMRVQQQQGGGGTNANVPYEPLAVKEE